MCDTDKELRLGNYAAAFNLSTSSMISEINSAELAAAVEKLQKETFKTLRLLENEIIRLSNK